MLSKIYFLHVLVLYASRLVGLRSNFLKAQILLEFVRLKSFFGFFFIVSLVVTRLLPIDQDKSQIQLIM